MTEREGIMTNASTPNRLSVPGEAAARERVEVVFGAVDRLSMGELASAAVPGRDPEEREILLAELEAAADRHGRGALLDEARERIRDALVVRAADPYVPVSALIGVHPAGRVEDTVAVVTAIEDAVSVAVAEDLLPPATAHALAGPGWRLLGLEGLAGDPDATPTPHAWEPSAADWAAAAVGDAGVEPDLAPPGTRALRGLFFGTAAVVGGIAALAWGVSQGSPWLGALIALAIAAVSWTLATLRSAR